jgi:hypothetical protein
MKGFHWAEPLVGVASIVVGCSVLQSAWQVLSRIGARAGSFGPAAREMRAP